MESKRFTSHIWLALLMFGLASCEAPSAPDLDNRGDPLYEGTPYRRYPHTMGNLHMTTADQNSISFAWEDRSSFDGGVRIRRKTDLQSNLLPWRTMQFVVPSPGIEWTDHPPLRQPFEYTFVVTASHPTASNNSTSNALDLFVSFTHHFFGPRASTAVTALSYAPDGTHLAMGTWNQVEFWNLADEQRRCLIEMEEYSIYNSTIHIRDMAFSADGSLLAVGSIYGLHLIRTSDCSQLLRADDYPSQNGGGTPRGAYAVVFNPEETLVATLSSDDIRIKRVSDGYTVVTLEQRTARVGPLAVAFSSDGAYLYTVTEQRLAIWRTDTWEEVDAFLWPEKEEPDAAAFSPNRQWLALNFELQTGEEVIKVFDLPSMNLVSQFPGGTHLGFSPDNQYLAYIHHVTVSVPRTSPVLILGDANTGEVKARFRDPTRDVDNFGAFAFSPDLRYVTAGYRAVTGFKKPRVTVWDLKGSWRIDSMRVRITNGRPDITYEEAFGN